MAHKIKYGHVGNKVKLFVFKEVNKFGNFMNN